MASGGVKLMGEGMKGELDLFLSPLTSKQIASSKYVWYQPKAPVSNAEVIEFVVEGISDQYIDLSKTKLHITGRFINAESGAVLHAHELFAPVNLLFHALWKQVDVLLNDKQVTHGSQTYAYKAYLETLLNYSEAAKKSTLQSAFYYEDTSGVMNNVAFDAANKGGQKRRTLAQSSAIIQMSDKLHLDIFNIDKYIVGNVKVHLKLTKQSAEFYAMRAAQSLTGGAGADAGTVAANSSAVIFQIQEANLKVFKVKPVVNVLMAHNAMLLKTPARYIINNVQTKVFTLSTGHQTINLDNIFLGKIPARVIMVMVDVRAFQGDYTRNPWQFQHFGVNSLYLSKDGVQYPSQPYQPDFSSGKILAMYEDLLECLDLWGRDKSNGLSLEKFKTDFTVFAWDLTPDMSASSNIFNGYMQGTVSLHMKFATTLAQNVNLFVYGENKNIMEIGFSGDVTVDFAV
jgi:hypothetical protein